MAFRANHNINGADGQDVELIAPGEGIRGIKSILFTNTDNEDISISLFIQDNPESGEGATSTFYLTYGLVIPTSTSFLLDDAPLLSFNNNKGGYGLYVHVGSTHTMDVLINT